MNMPLQRLPLGARRFFSFLYCLLGLAISFTPRQLNAQAPPGSGQGAGGVSGAVFSAYPAQPAQPAADLPAGSIDVRVLGVDGKPAGGASIQLAVLGSLGQRDKETRQTAANGQYRFQGLPTGSKQAYRLYVVFDGARLGTTPFRLPEDQGYRATLRMLGTTGDEGRVFMMLGQLSVELRDERLHISQYARLTNAGRGVYVFPEGGLSVPLPPGHLAFQWQKQMSDQRGEEDGEEGFRLSGSLPPGTAELSWSFDMPIEGSRMKFDVPLPWRAFTYRVIADAPVGMTMKVSELPAFERFEDKGRQLMGSQIQRGPGASRLNALTVRIEGIPGPGPGRWVAAGLALFALLTGVFVALRPAGALDQERLLSEHEDTLLENARRLESERVAGEIGPHYHARRKQELVMELASVMRERDLQRVRDSSSTRRSDRPRAASS